jgi:hypothetical protein
VDDLTDGSTPGGLTHLLFDGFGVGLLEHRPQ